MRKIEKIRQAVADYMQSEGCSCCQDSDAHAIAKKQLAQLLNVPKYKDGSGYDFGKFKGRPSSSKSRERQRN